jgi:hypothetical protein
LAALQHKFENYEGDKESGSLKPESPGNSPCPRERIVIVSISIGVWEEQNILAKRVGAFIAARVAPLQRRLGGECKRIRRAMGPLGRSAAGHTGWCATAHWALLDSIGGLRNFITML